MIHTKLRRQIAWEAARLLFSGQENECYRARLRAARRLCRGWIPADQLPDEVEIRRHVRQFSQMQNDGFLPPDRVPLPEEPQTEFEPDAPRAEPSAEERFSRYRNLLLPLESVKLDRVKHPEGDALYHSLQVFELAREAIPYDEEFLLAALLHDVGKAIDKEEHVAAGLEALEGLITERTAWLIENHSLAHDLLDQTIGARARRRLKRHDSFEELEMLARCDRDGRQPGMAVPDVDQALAYIRALDDDGED